MPRPTWHDLADSELRARLVQRGVEEEEAADLVRNRDEAYHQRDIDRALR